jgi:hypothetical protein
VVVRRPARSPHALKALFTRALLLGLILGLIAPVPAHAHAHAQEPRACAFRSWTIGGEWTTTETVHGANESLWRANLRLVQRGEEVAGRLEAPSGQPERAVLGTYRDGVLSITELGVSAAPRAAVEAAPARRWVLSLSSDGRLLSGSWWEDLDNRGRGRSGELFASGEAACAPDGAPTVSAAPEAQGAVPPGAVLDAGPPGCVRWDLTGAWRVDDGREGEAGPQQRQQHWLRLWQQDGRVLGWYEPAAVGVGVGVAPLSGATRWVVDGRLDGRTLRLTHHLGDGATLERLLELSADGLTLVGTHPIQLGPPATERLAGSAACVRSPADAPRGGSIAAAR